MFTKKSVLSVGKSGKVFVVSTALAVASVLPWVFTSPNIANATLELCVDESVSLVDEAQASQNERHSRLSYVSTASQGQLPDEGLFWNSLTKTWFTEEQINLMGMAYEIGLEDGGAEHARVLQGVLLQETIAGQLGRIGHMTAPVGKRSYGVMQVKVTAARDVLKKHRDAFKRYRSDEALIVDLMTDDEMNIRMASKFLLMLKSRSNSLEHALVAYNVGYRASKRVPDYDKFKYVVKVKRHLAVVVAPFNEKFIRAPINVAMN